MYWHSDDRSVQFSFNRQKSGLNKAFYRHRSSSVFLTDILKYGLDRQSKCTKMVYYNSALAPGGAEGGGAHKQFFDRDARPRTNFNYPKK